MNNRWAEWDKEVLAQTARKIPLSAAERSRKYRQNKALAKAEGGGAENDKRSWVKRNKLERKIHFGSPPETELLAIESPCPSLNSVFDIELVTPLTINKIFSELRVKGYQIQGLQESFMLSPLAAVQENIQCYRPLFPGISANSEDSIFPVVQFTFPGAVAFERYFDQNQFPATRSNLTSQLRYPLCFSRRTLDYQPVSDLLDTIYVLSKAVTSRSTPSDLETSIHSLEEAVQRSDHGALIKNLASINKIFSSVPPLKGADASCYFRLLQEIYGRCLKPKHTLLKSGRDNTVYGELMPIFLERLFNEANLVEDSVFLDLGSGAGNTVAQAALTHRCRSFGIEIRRDVAAIAETMLRTAIVRSEIWGIPIGKMEVVCGDMLQSAEVIEWINTADLVLVNNRIFPSSLNEKIKNLIKTMKLGAVLVSLVSFQLCGVNRSGAARKGTDDVGAMFEVRQSHYSSDDISWSSKGGNYYVHTKIR